MWKSIHTQTDTGWDRGDNGEKSAPEIEGEWLCKLSLWASPLVAGKFPSKGQLLTVRTGALNPDAFAFCFCSGPLSQVAFQWLIQLSQTNVPHRNWKDHQVWKSRAVDELPHASPPWRPLLVPEGKPVLGLQRRCGLDLSIPTHADTRACFYVHEAENICGGRNWIGKEPVLPEMRKPK